ncbi:hypothetical protein ACWJKU_15410 [Methylocaldum sp. MU1018]
MIDDSIASDSDLNLAYSLLLYSVIDDGRNDISREQYPSPDLSSARAQLLRERRVASKRKPQSIWGSLEYFGDLANVQQHTVFFGQSGGSVHLSLRVSWCLEEYGEVG